MGTYDPMPVNGQTTDWGTWLRNAIGDLDGRVSTLSAGTGAGSGGIYYVDDQAGATDDDKFDNALSASRNANGFTGTVIFSNRNYTLARTHTLQSGDHIYGLPGAADERRSSGNKCRVTCTVNGTAFTIPAHFTHSISMGGIQWYGSSSTSWLDPGNPLGLDLQTCHFRDMGFTNFKSVLGSKANKLVMTACKMDGYWNINGSYQTAVHIGGSDNDLWTNGLLIDSPPSFMGSTGSEYHMWFDFLEFSTIGPLYITAEVNSGVLLDGYGIGSASAHGLRFQSQYRNTGRNIGQPTYGCATRINGGISSFHGGIAAWEMTNPSSTGRGDLGVYDIRGGDVLIEDMTYQRASTVGESVPFIYVGSGARCRIRNIRRSGPWTGLPQVTGPGSIDADNSVTVV